MVSKDMIIQRMIDAGFLREEIEAKLVEKKKDMPDISEDGVAVIVARELGVSIMQPLIKELKIGSIIPNMRNITFYGKIVDKQPVREFETERGSGRVQNVLLADETGRIRMSLWNDEIKKAESLGVGDVAKLSNCITKKDNLENPEVRLGYSGDMEKADMKVETQPAKSTLSDVVVGDDVEVSATLLEIFERPILYQFCPQCRSKLFNGVCAEHGVIDEANVNKTLIMAG
ncbi:MAG: hypothetical protein ABIG30_02500, partial [Candidatus Aenigmatarchaeota archaeon]